MTKPPDAVFDAVYTAADVRETAGLSYRQLADWETKGVIENPREDGTGWRKFTSEELFALMVAAEVRRRFGLPVERLRWVREQMLQPGARAFRSTVEQMAGGVAVLLVTDLEQMLVIEPDLELESSLRSGSLRSERDDALLVLKLNPLVNRLLMSLKQPLQLRINDAFYEMVRNNRGEVRLWSAGEAQVLELIRSGHLRRVTIHLRDGRIDSAEAEEEFGPTDRERMLKILEEGRFQTVTVTKNDGKVVRAVRKTPIRFGARRVARQKKT